MGSRYMMLGPLKPSHIHEVIFSQKQVKTLIFYTQSISNQPLSSLLSQLHKPKREYFKLVEFRTSCKQVCAQDLFFFSWSFSSFPVCNDWKTKSPGETQTPKYETFNLTIYRTTT